MAHPIFAIFLYKHQMDQRFGGAGLPMQVCIQKFIFKFISITLISPLLEAGLLLLCFYINTTANWNAENIARSTKRRIVPITGARVP